MAGLVFNSMLVVLRSVIKCSWSEHLVTCRWFGRLKGRFFTVPSSAQCLMCAALCARPCDATYRSQSGTDLVQFAEVERSRIAELHRREWHLYSYSMDVLGSVSYACGWSNALVHHKRRLPHYVRSPHHGWGLRPIAAGHTADATDQLWQLKRL